MEMIKVESSNVKSIGWEWDTLYVEYTGGTYSYKNVKRDIFLQLLGAKSRGRFMNLVIKPNYECRKV